MKKLGDNLKILRNEAKLSMRELALKIGISHNTLAAYERNIVVPTVPNAMKICEFFKVPVEFLVYGKTVLRQEFKDNELMALANEIDELKDAETKKLAKKYMKKLIANFEEKKRLEEEAE